eukprot:COSAG02_NODE_13248_length_1421_cov_1.056732_1_plen_92_part_10
MINKISPTLNGSQNGTVFQYRLFPIPAIPTVYGVECGCRHRVFDGMSRGGGTGSPVMAEPDTPMRQAQQMGRKEEEVEEDWSMTRQRARGGD